MDPLQSANHPILVTDGIVPSRLLRPYESRTFGVEAPELGTRFVDDPLVINYLL